nr:DedA family protein [Roseomonas acroporae]
MVDPWILMFCVWGGSFLGDQLWFSLGRRYGQRAVSRIPGAERRVATALGFLERYGVAFVLTFRFIYGVRNVAAAACGLSEMSRTRFMMLNFIAAGVWAASFVAAGWFAVAWLGEKGTLYALGAIGVAAVVYLAVRAMISRRRKTVVVV